MLSKCSVPEAVQQERSWLWVFCVLVGQQPVPGKQPAGHPVRWAVRELNTPGPGQAGCGAHQLLGLMK